MQEKLKVKVMELPREKLTTSLFKILCLKKLEVGQILTDVLALTKTVELTFDDQPYPRSMCVCSYSNGVERRKVSVIYNFNWNHGDANVSFETIDDLPISDEIVTSYKPYMYGTKDVIVNSTTSLRLKLDTDSKIDTSIDTLKERINEKIENILFQSQNLHRSYRFLCYLESISMRTHTGFIGRKSINQFAKLKNWIDLFNDSPGLPKKKNLHRVIDCINENRATLDGLVKSDKGMHVRSAQYSIEYVKYMAGKTEVQLKIGSFLVFKDKNIGRFKYLFHPGLNVFVRFLEESNNIENFDNMIEKQLFRLI